MARADNLPRGAYRYNSLTESDQAVPVRFPHFKTAPRIDAIPANFHDPEITASNEAIANRFATGGMIIEATIAFALRGPRITLLSFLDKKEPTTGILKGDLLDFAAEDLENGILGLREGSITTSTNSEDSKKFLAGDIFAIRTHREREGKILAVEGEGIGLVVNANHPLIEAYDIPNESVVEILESVIAAEILLREARSDNALKQYLEGEEIDSAMDWLMRDLVLPLAN